MYFSKYFYIFRQIQAFDLDAFEDTELDSASRIMQMFAKQNNRVLKIFETSDDESDSQVINYNIFTITTLF